MARSTGLGDLADHSTNHFRNGFRRIVMHLKKIDDQWWIMGAPSDWVADGLPGIGPYASRWDAEDDKEGLEKYPDWTPRQISVDSPARVQKELL